MSTRISSVAFCSLVMRACAEACSISASDCLSSDSFSCFVRRSVVESNWTTMSPGFTREPFFASFRIWSSPDCIGAASTMDLSGRISPRISSASTNSPLVTSAVGRSGAEPLPTRTNAAVHRGQRWPA